jgi:hypothetical protein
MKRLALTAALLLGLIASASAQERKSTDHIQPLGYCQLTSIASATSVSSCSGGVPALSAWAVVCIETAAVRWRDDGTAPTTSVGMPVSSGQCMNYSGTFSALQFIAQSGSPVVDISFYSGAPKT